MPRYCVLILLALSTICTYGGASHIPESERLANRMRIKREPLSAHSNVDNSNEDALEAYVLYRPTEKPHPTRPTRKPGTYLQSIWDIYFPERN